MRPHGDVLWRTIMELLGSLNEKHRVVPGRGTMAPLFQACLVLNLLFLFFTCALLCRNPAFPAASEARFASAQPTTTTFLSFLFFLSTLSKPRSCFCADIHWPLLERSLFWHQAAFSHHDPLILSPHCSPLNPDRGPQNHYTSSVVSVKHASRTQLLGLDSHCEPRRDCSVCQTHKQKVLVYMD